MGLVASQPVAAAKFSDRLTQELLGVFHAFALVTALGEPIEELFDQRRNRSAALGRNDPGTTIGSVIQ